MKQFNEFHNIPVGVNTGSTSSSWARLSQIVKIKQKHIEESDLYLQIIRDQSLKLKVNS